MTPDDLSRPRNVDRVCTALRLPRDLHARLSAAADERGVGMNWLIVRLLDESMDRLIPVSELLLTRSEEARRDS